MEIAISLSAKGKSLPKWASAFDDPKYLDMLKTGKVTARHLLRVLNKPSAHKISGKWGGSWSIDTLGVITVELEKSYVAACLKVECAWAIGHTIMHELEEAKAATAIAREKFPEVSPYVIANIAPGNLGGDAHMRACLSLDGLSETAYDKEQSKESTFIGW